MCNHESPDNSSVTVVTISLPSDAQPASVAHTTQSTTDITVNGNSIHSVRGANFTMQVCVFGPLFLQQVLFIQLFDSSPNLKFCIQSLIPHNFSVQGQEPQLPLTSQLMSPMILVHLLLQVLSKSTKRESTLVTYWLTRWLKTTQETTSAVPTILLTVINYVISWLIITTVKSRIIRT